MKRLVAACLGVIPWPETIPDEVAAACGLKPYVAETPEEGRQKDVRLATRLAWRLGHTIEEEDWLGQPSGLINARCRACRDGGVILGRLKWKGPLVHQLCPRRFKGGGANC